MSQKFVMLFLVSDTRIVCLDVAAKILIGEDQDADQDKNKFKSKHSTVLSGPRKSNQVLFTSLKTSIIDHI